MGSDKLPYRLSMDGQVGGYDGNVNEKASIHKLMGDGFLFIRPAGVLHICSSMVLTMLVAVPEKYKTSSFLRTF